MKKAQNSDQKAFSGAQRILSSNLERKIRGHGLLAQGSFLEGYAEHGRVAAHRCRDRVNAGQPGRNVRS
jgi:hypothetical protein